MNAVAEGARCDTAFVHLHVHSEYSLVDGLMPVAGLVEAVRRLAMPAVALTERANLFSVVKFYRRALACGVKPLVGVDIAVADTQGSGDAGTVVLLCRGVDGYRALNALTTRAYREGLAHGVPMLEPRWLRGYGDRLIALSGGMDGEVGRALLAGNRDEAKRCAARWQERFPGGFYLELARIGRAEEERYIEEACELALALDLPVVATNEARFLERGDFEAHEARVCIHEGRTLADARRVRRYTAQQYLRSAEEMRALFADLPEAIENTVEIARRCNVMLELGQTHLPDFPVPGEQGVVEWLKGQARDGLRARLAAQPPAADDGYPARLERELDVITEMGFAGYFLIVADFIRWARENGVPVGPGRGSGAGSLVAYALGITDVDPIAYDLLFERFLNPERVSLPDFDVDFCMEGRDRVIEYVARRYGEDRVAQIITFGTMAAKAVVRDVGRVLGHPYGFVDQLAKLIPFELGMTLDKALEQEVELRRRYEEEEEVRTLVDLARKLEGIARNAGRHAGGVVIAPTTLTDFTALYSEHPGTATVTQLDKDDVETVGLVKFDFLGLRTLTIIDRAVVQVNARRARAGEAPVDIARIALDDPAPFALIKQARTTAVFQLESRGIKDLIRRLQPDCFEDLIALVALYRPGPLQSGMVEDFVDRKHGRAVVHYPHPALAAILKPTYGVILYQEQVMQIAQELSGYSLGGADLLRRAMGKKKPEEMDRQREAFVDGARARAVDEAVARQLFDLIAKFAGYGFNKSHSAAYAVVTYQTAWLKAHYPAEFMAAVLTADMDSTDKVLVLIEECRAMGIEVLPPDLNQCQYAFTASDRAVRYGLGAVKGVGQSAIEAIVQARDADGAYRDLFDFCRRVDGPRVNRRSIEALIRAGALDGLGPSRAAMMATLTRALQAAEQFSRDRSAGQSDLFGGATAPAAMEQRFQPVEEWGEEDLLAAEKETLGVYLSGHPITRYQSELAQCVDASIAELPIAAGRRCTVAGLIVAMRTMNSRKGRMAVLTLDDSSARIEAVLYNEVYQRYQARIARDHLLIVEGELRADESGGGASINVSRVYDLNELRAQRARRLLVCLAQSACPEDVAQRLADALGPYTPGPLPVSVEFDQGDATVELPLAERWSVRPCEELLERLRTVAGDDTRVRILYARNGGARAEAEHP